VLGFLHEGRGLGIAAVEQGYGSAETQRLDAIQRIVGLTKTNLTLGPLHQPHVVEHAGAEEVRLGEAWIQG